MTETSDPQLHLKKKARRRLVGAVAIAGFAAVILPMVMDEEPKPVAQDVQIRIPGQEQLQFDPKELAARSSSPPVAVAAGEEHDGVASADALPREAVKPAKDKPPATPAVARAPEKTAEKTAEKNTAKPADKPPVKKAVSPPAVVGKTVEAPPAAPNGQYVILIGAFANPANVKKLLASIGKIGVPTYTEILNAPDGKRTRVRAGPFPNRDAADKALDKLKRIGVGGVVAGRP
ncbi:SPOR domain-containing protein [Accumulibacter sp.]|uniref:SPOR domain-containing protein n=1 Tax=Accumulibacter sp. TaxID=2053492 RepID=UPI0028C42B26|nr:SPOR domain-containing protein [Accumulibacter sp.]